MEGRAAREMSWVTNVWVFLSFLCFIFAIISRVTHQHYINADIFYSSAFVCMTVSYFATKKHLAKIKEGFEKDL